MGKLPAEWKTARISSLYVPRNEKVSADDYPALSVTMQGIVPQLETAAKSQDTDNRKLVKEGDFVINSRSDRRGSCGIAHQDGSVSLISNILNPINSDLMDLAFFEYLFKTEGFADEYYKWGTGIVDDLWSTNWSRMKNIVVAFPSHEDQKRIAEYLDTRTSEIDLLIEQTERSIDLLEEYRKSVISETVTKGLDIDVPMKDSGIEWIGEIPEHWDVDSLSRSMDMITNGYVGPTRNLFHDSGVRYIQSLHVVEGTLDFQKQPYYVSEDWSAQHSRSILHEGDVLIVQTGAIGNVAYVDSKFEGCNCHALIILRSSSSVLGKYLFYCLYSNRGKDAMLMTKTGATHPHLNSTKIRHVSIPIPPIADQEFIVEYLDKVEDFLSPIISDKKKAIAVLKEYRKSLIYEAVTGKFRVPGAE